jgi:hypothetical protein
MNVAATRVALWLEVSALVAPTSVVLGLAAPLALSVSMSDRLQPYGPVLALAVIASAFALLALWVLSWGCLVASKSFGPIANRLLLVLCSAGALVAFCAFASNRLPASPEYSPLGHLRDWLAPFALGLVMVIPAAHMLYYQRKFASV